MQLHVRDCGLRSAFFSVAFTKYVDLCICYIYFEQALQRIVDACLFQSTKRSEASRSISAGSLKQTSTNAYHISVDSERRFRGAMWESLRERVFSSPWLESRRQALLSCRRDEIRYFVKVISPRKVSFRRVIASAPFPPTATALHATRARKEEKEYRGIEGTWRWPISKTGPLILPEETPHFGHRW